MEVSNGGIIGVILTINMSSPDPLTPSRLKFGITVIATSVIVFTIISIMTNNWMFFSSEYST